RRSDRAARGGARRDGENGSAVSVGVVDVVVQRIDDVDTGTGARCCRGGDLLGGVVGEQHHPIGGVALGDNGERADRVCPTRSARNGSTGEDAGRGEHACERQAGVVGGRALVVVLADEQAIAQHYEGSSVSEGG